MFGEEQDRLLRDRLTRSRRGQSFTARYSIGRSRTPGPTPHRMVDEARGGLWDTSDLAQPTGRSSTCMSRTSGARLTGRCDSVPPSQFPCRQRRNRIRPSSRPLRKSIRHLATKIPVVGSSRRSPGCAFNSCAGLAVDQPLGLVHLVVLDDPSLTAPQLPSRCLAIRASKLSAGQRLVKCLAGPCPPTPARRRTRFGHVPRRPPDRRSNGAAPGDTADRGPSVRTKSW